jgi:hypothetical protein
VFRRNETRTRKELLREELGESWEHALRAAGHAADGMRAAVGPRVGPAADRVRGAAASGWGSTRAALVPVGEAAQHKVKEVRLKRKPPRRRWPKLVGLLAGGVAVGAAAAFVLRRRRDQQWEDYHHTEPAGTGSHAASTGGTGGGGRAAAGTGTAGARAGGTGARTGARSPAGSGGSAGTSAGTGPAAAGESTRPAAGQPGEAKSGSGPASGAGPRGDNTDASGARTTRP